MGMAKAMVQGTEMSRLEVVAGMLAPDWFESEASKYVLIDSDETSLDR